jgi:hypothetical protein
MLLACCRPIQYQHFRGRQPWWQSQTSVRVVVIAGGAGVIYYVTHIETVPYTHRRHAVLVSPATERHLGTQTFKQVRPLWLSVAMRHLSQSWLWSLLSQVIEQVQQAHQGGSPQLVCIPHVSWEMLYAPTHHPDGVCCCVCAHSCKEGRHAELSSSLAVQR